MKFARAALCVSLIAFQIPPALAGWAHGSNTSLNFASPLGINLAPGSDFPFLNAMWNGGAGSWGFNSGGLNSNLTDLSLDANGWPTSSFRGGSGTIYTDGLGFGVSTRPFDSNFTLFCSGQGSVQFQGAGNSPLLSCPSTSGTNFTMSSGPGLFKGTLTNVDQTNNGSHITALAVIPTAYATQFLNAGCLSNPAQTACMNPDFKTINGPFRVLRFMDYMATNSNFTTLSWSNRPTPSYPFFNLGSSQTYFGGATLTWGLPIELQNTLCNFLNASCWINFPLLTSNDYATNTAAYFAANASKPRYYEYVNEPWNTNSLQTQLENLGATAFSTSASFVAGMSYYQMQADHLFGLVTASETAGQFYRVLGIGPNQNSQGTTCPNCANWWWFGGPSQGNLWSGWTLSHFDVAGLAPYFGDGIPDAWGAPSLLGNLFAEIQTGGAIPNSSSPNTTTGSANTYSLTSSSACGNGVIPATPSNGTFTCFKVNVNQTGNTTLAVDGGTRYPVYWPRGSTNQISSFQLNSGTLATGNTWVVTFTTTTGAAAWNSGTAYGSANGLPNYPVVGSDGNTYYCFATNCAIGDDPTTDGGVHWQALTPAWWICNACGYHASGYIADSTIAITQTLATMASNSVSMPLVCYESGESFADIGDPFQPYTLTAAITDNRWLSVYPQYYAAVKSAGQTGECLHFNDVGWSIFGTWGYTGAMYNSSGIAPATTKQQSLYNYISANPKPSLP